MCGQVSTLETAFCLSAQNFTAFGYGDVVLTERWRLLSPLEATNGLLFFGMSTAVLFAIMSQLIANRLRSETGYQSEATGKWRLRRWPATHGRVENTNSCQEDVGPPRRTHNEQRDTGYGRREWSGGQDPVRRHSRGRAHVRGDPAHHDLPQFMHLAAWGMNEANSLGGQCRRPSSSTKAALSSALGRESHRCECRDECDAEDRPADLSAPGTGHPRIGDGSPVLRSLMSWLDHIGSNAPGCGWAEAWFSR